jgi:miniconductance mechanosensitive channel
MFETLRSYHPMLPDIAAVLILLLGAWLGYWLAKRSLVAAAHMLARRTEHTWDDALIEARVASRLAQLVPGFIVYTGVGLLPGLGQDLKVLLLNVTSAYMILVVTLTVTAVLSAVNAIYETDPANRERPIKGFIQLLQLGVLLIGAVLVIAALIDRSPVILLSGFGAMTAVLLLVFRDTILSLVASVQLTTQDMVRVGDWIEMSQFGADGDVIDVALHTVKVQNWDKTITTIPTHRLISDSFKNWRGMSQSGGRRIKRAVYLDTGSIRFLSDEEAQHFRRFDLLRDYIDEKQQELAESNSAMAAAGADEGGVNMRRLTNIGTFRAYLYNYLRQHPRVHRGMTLLVRQLAPGPQGLPIEVYCFTNTTDWNSYEGIQGDIFDHMLAIVPEFGLRVFQEPSGADLAAACGGLDAPQS